MDSLRAGPKPSDPPSPGTRPMQSFSKGANRSRSWARRLVVAGLTTVFAFPSVTRVAAQGVPARPTEQQAGTTVPGGDGLQPAASARDGPAPNSRVGELTVEALVHQVLARSPSLAQMTAAWQAASARYPQVTALDDPLFTAQLAPPSFGSNNVSPGYNVQLNQKYPFPGKRCLRGQSALAEADAAGHDVDDMRLQLVESATVSFFDFYLVDRALAVNREGLDLLQKFRRDAVVRYQNGRAPQQDVSQGDVEIGRQQERQLTLVRMRRVAVARINTLMHLPPDAPLPPPPARLEPAAPLPDVQLLRARAADQRPDLHALAARLAADRAALDLARREYAPDFEVMAAYNTLMGNGPARDLAPQVGVSVNLPVRRERRHAAVAEAQARLAQRQAEFDRQLDQVNFQVQEAYEQVQESEQTVRLYEQTILPAARRNVSDAQSAYVNGKTPFLSLIEAQRNVVGLLDRSYEAVADSYRRRAHLERAVGGPLVPVVDATAVSPCGPGRSTGP